ncbi:hypothetical protein [Caulobacter sp. 1776]|uniref:hypothetical protein n=1 Tax=Caulobacter sp. 1776 TaxID=3156420 RepID=UPI00339B9342
MFKRKAALVAVGVVVLGAGVAGARQERGAPGVSLAQSVVAAASAFEHYTHHAGAISAGFRGGDDVAQALRQGAAYKPDQFEEGMIAYGAIAALQERDFVEGVRRAGREIGPEALAQRLTAQPDAVMEIEGVGPAAARVQAVLLRQSAPLASTGRAVKQSAYDIQHQDWSKGSIVDTAGRLARVKSISNTAFSPDDGDASRLIQSATERQETGGAEGGGAFTPVTARAAALAALAVLGAAGDADAASLTPVLHDPKADSCVKMAKLNLYQCLAVAGPHYEDVFCLGQHALMDTAQCVSDAAGGARMSPAPARSRGFTVPVASN